MDKVRPFRYTRGKLSVEVTLAVIITAWLWRAATWGYRRLKPVAYHPLALAGIGAQIAACALSWWVLLWLNAAIGGMLLNWRLAYPHSYHHHIHWRIDSFLAGFKYRHRPRRKLEANGLINDKDPIPTISTVRKEGCITRVRVKMSHGDEINYWRERSARLAQTYAALDCKVNPYRREVLNPFKHEMVTKPRWLELQFLTRDPFSTGLGVEYINYHADRPGNPVVATYRNGEPYEYDLEAHTLAVAMTRRGKSNRIRVILYATKHLKEQKLLEDWMIDGKGGVEGAFVEHQIARHAYGDTELNPNAYSPAEFDKLLKDAVKVLKRRQRKMRGKATKFIPTPNDPWLRIIIDELLVLTSKSVPPELRTSIAASIRLIQQQGIACGVILDAATQLAQKELVDFRDGFTKFEVGKVERGVVDMIFGTGWWERGARADEIPDDLPGVFYVKTDATMVPAEIRYPLVTDADLKPLKQVGASALWPPRKQHLQAVTTPQPPLQSKPEPEPEYDPLDDFGVS